MVAMGNGHRLAFLIVEAEPAQGLSTRKLLLESAKHNVLTAYSPREGERMFQRFPHVDVVAIDGSLGEEACSRLVKQLKDQNADIRVVAFVPQDGAQCKWADETTSSHDPAGLLKLLEEMGGRTDIA
jgi:DNA-binding NtrC family response regulator